MNQSIKRIISFSVCSTKRFIHTRTIAFVEWFNISERVNEIRRPLTLNIIDAPNNATVKQTPQSLGVCMPPPITNTDITCAYLYMGDHMR